MIGNYRINLGAGIVGFILTFCSIQQQFVDDQFNSRVNRIRSLVRPCFCFTLGLGLLLTPSAGSKGFDYDPQIGPDMRGSQVDIKLEDDGQELNDLLKNGQNASSGEKIPPSETKAPTGFAPLDPPKLVRTKDPEELAQAVRHLTDK